MAAKPGKKKSVTKPVVKARRKRSTKAHRGGWWSRCWPVALRGVLALSVLLAVWIIWLDAKVRERFDGNKWTLPAAVYARPLELYPGKLMTAAQLKAELTWNDYRGGVWPDRPGYYYQDGDRFVIYRRAFEFAEGREGAQSLEVRLNAGRVQSVRMRGQEVNRVRLEPLYIGGIFPAQNEDRELLRLEDYPPALVAALVRTEDQYFLDHWGISVRGIARAMLANAKAGGVVQGGSTLTQQLVKNFFLTHERSFSRKFQEVFMALLLEFHYGKKEILQTYLNEVYLGQAGRRAIHGFGLAARFYFAKPVNELNHAEMATLVGMVKGASYYNPRRHPARAQERRDLVLKLMAEHGVLTPQQYHEAVAYPLLVAPAKRAGQREYPAFLELVRRQLQHDFQLVDLQNGGLRIHTSLDPWLQHNLERAASEQLQRLEQRHPSLGSELEVAAIITSTHTGQVRALLGSRQGDYFGFNRALDAKRAIGSLAKPVIYLSALESGYWYWGKLLSDAPVVVKLSREQHWQPQNYDKVSHGTVPMLQALTQSYNQASVRLGMTVGLKNIAINFARLGLDESLPPYPSILLGAMPLSVYQTAQFYQAIAAQGQVQPLASIVAVNNQRGQLLRSFQAQTQQEFSPETMELLRYGLEQVAEHGTARTLKSSLGTGIAAKTGTSNDQRDAWFMGFDQRHLGIVWVGRDDNQSMPVNGASAALPIWQQTFAALGVEPLAPLQLVSWAKLNQGQFVANNCQGQSYPLLAAQVPANLMPCDVRATDKSAADSEATFAPVTPAAKPKKKWYRWFIGGQ